MRATRTLGMIAALVLAQAASGAEEKSAAKTIHTMGQAVVYVSPDEVTLRAGIETFHASLAMAKTQNAAAAAKMLEAVKSLGVSEKNIQTDVLNVELVYERDRIADGVKGYRISRSYQITLTDVAKFETLIDAVLTNGANRLMGFHFSTKNLRKHRDEARTMAVKAAREKAQDLVGALDGKILRPVSIREADAFHSANVSLDNEEATALAGEVGGGITPQGKIRVTASVNIEFEYSLNN